jgi:hypothetical protein
MNHIEHYKHQHPRVAVDLDRWVLVIEGQYPYEIDLEQCTTSARLLDFIFQVSRKPWCDRALAGEVLSALERACRIRFRNNAQGTYCPRGRSMRVNWAEGYTEAIKVYLCDR